MSATMNDAASTSPVLTAEALEALMRAIAANTGPPAPCAADMRVNKAQAILLRAGLDPLRLDTGSEG